MTTQATRDNTTTVSLHPTAPFDFGLALAYLSRSPFEILDVVDDWRYRRAIHIQDRPVLFQVESVGELEQPQLDVTLLTPGATAAELAHIVKLVARIFRIEQDMRLLESLSQSHAGFAALQSRLRGLRALVMVSPFESLVWSILGQQINVAFAYRLKRALVERYGEQLEFGGSIYHLFPRVERLASLDSDELRPLQFSGQKAR
jgi:DNA-3-methyladenine glycosylase II